MSLFHGFLNTLSMEVMSLVTIQLSHHFHGFVRGQANTTLGVMIKFASSELNSAQRSKNLLDALLIFVEMWNLKTVAHSIINNRAQQCKVNNDWYEPNNKNSCHHIVQKFGFLLSSTVIIMTQKHMISINKPSDNKSINQSQPDNVKCFPVLEIVLQKVNLY